MTNMENQTPEPQLKHLHECSRASCGHILMEDERVWTPPDENRRTATCPKCGGDSFYTLNEMGQRISYSQREKYRNGIDLATLSPSPRMGSKRKAALLRVKAFYETNYAHP